MPNAIESNQNLQVAPLQNELTMSVLMTPDLANFTGNVHGGDLLKMLDQVAYACASRYSGGYVVTLSVDQVIFREPIHVGELVTFLASVNYVGKTSMEVGIRVQAENIQNRTIRHTNSCYFTMVAVDQHGKRHPWKSKIACKNVVKKPHRCVKHCVFKVTIFPNVISNRQKNASSIFL